MEDIPNRGTPEVRRHRRRDPKGQDVLFHDFDRKARMLRLLFVSPDGKLMPVTYRPCPLCGVTMEETAPPW